MSGEPEDLPDAVRRVEIAALSRTLPFRVVRTATIARTAEEAAEAVNVEVGQIVKSLVFRASETDRAVLLLVSGANRVDTKKLAALLGEPVERPDADFVRERTGFAIGGVAPLGSTHPLPVYMDRTLMGFDVVWAAAGTPFHVFETVPDALRIATDADVVALS
ncbi:YbaK/EbsC family protein [Aureimonas jatrophae]|uniref:Cys-tRNA(Pro) deacylase, prolyl-tRNA editing enzyme YbaK/EbsC n=1 Tax=Aureimonas jatrophae TaxID=1166073 RepID=A0A1H0K6Q0_9HYPH|nr:YbaK/EbsC family protein [Aureimonas jatrophae]MBB3950973.1 prolyl-tRNA editing enzyme YbaK/EbsC (Cys-tRNA(Pro) deacylase) [Aureimonas jatrophae]SDO51559.1 Cys-tRNA(Pro) deacylase, prolyl-tRNA editing enzyme YbaK/EbsC [Aureimonas jatrophae]